LNIDAKTLARLDALIWILIFVGLFVLVLGIASHDETAIGGWSLSVLGTLSTVAGVVLIYVRSRLPEAPPPGAQSPQQGKETGR
jgi:vacuolar-type H+-ATPase subunit I/STV1